MKETLISIGGACFFLWRNAEGEPVLRSEFFRCKNARHATKGNWALWLSFRHLPKVHADYCSWAAASFPLPEGVNLQTTDDYGNKGFLPGSWVYATSSAEYVFTCTDNRKRLEKLGLDPSVLYKVETGRNDFAEEVAAREEYVAAWISGLVL